MALQGESLTHQALPFTVFLLTRTSLSEQIDALQPNAIISDAGYPWAWVLAKRLRIPFISSCSSGLQPPSTRMVELTSIPYVQKSTEILKQELGIVYDAANVYRNYTDYTIAWSLPQLNSHYKDGSESSSRSTNNNTIYFYGSTCTRDDLERPLVDQLAKDIQSFSGKIIYVSMGTVAGQKGWTLFLDHFFATVLETFANKPDYRVILSIGKRFNAEKLPHPLPSNVWVRQRVNQKEVLRVVDLFISHGGNNSVHESLFFATPLLVIPIFGDQHANGQVVEDQQLGLQIPSPFRPKLSTDLNHVTKEILMKKVNQLFRHEKAFENNLKLLQQQFLTKNEWIRNHAVQQMNEYVVQWNLKDSHQKSSPVLIH